jgi:phage tail tape-measure protein
MLVHSPDPSAMEHMGKVMAFVGATAGGYAGWALGALVGTFSAFAVSIVGTAVGVYYGRRIGRGLEA